MMNKYAAVICLVTLGLSRQAAAQFADRPVLRDSIYSEILKEQRYLEIVLPEDYVPGRDAPDRVARTGVIYVTDGEWNTVIASHIEHFLEIQFIPQHIIVGIDDAPKGKRNLRFRDLTPTHDPNDHDPVANGGSGGGDAFLAFISTELMPYINHKYANDGKNILFGHSLGGLFGMYALLKNPQAFTGYLLADPSLWWNHGELVKMARDKLAGLPDTAKFLFIAGRSGEALKGMGDVGMDSALKEQARGSLRWKSVAYDDETHNSMPFRTLYDGLKFIYRGYYASRNLGFRPASGFVLKDKPVTVHCMNDNFSDIYYTLDGSPPTTASTVLTEDTILVTAGSKLTLKAIGNQAEYNKTLSGDFQESGVFPTVTLPKAAQAGGLRYDYYLVKDSADLARAKPVFSGRADSAFRLGEMEDPEKYICVFSGWVRASEEGYFIVGSSSWGSSKVYLDKHLVIDQPDTDHVDFETCIVPLSRGFYPIRVEHILKQSQQKMQLYFIPLGLTEGRGPMPLPWQAMYSVKPAGSE
jgi:predicted alpha/beta superfamily hydrolase